MKSLLHASARRAPRAHVVFAASRLSCALGLLLAACSGADATLSPRAGAEGSQAFEADRVEGTSAGTKAGDASRASFDACVKRAVAASGSVSAVTTLECPATEASPCSTLDLAALAKFKGLTSLDLSNRCVVDLRPLAGLLKLETLTLPGNRIEDVRPLGSLSALRALDLSRNPVRATWSFKTTEPFSRLTRLEVLKLDDVPLNNILPLGSLSALQELHLRRGQVPSLRPLRTLTSLRKLYVDENEFTDLSPLEDMLQLEQLTANQNQVFSLDTIRHLAERGRLTSASLDASCVAMCDDVQNAKVSCVGGSDGCGHSEELIANAGDMSVPLAFVERDAPSADLPIWTQEDVQLAFDLIKERVDWSDPTSGCSGRASDSVSVLDEGEFPALTKVWAFGNLRALTPNAKHGFVSFDWHVAPAVRTARGFMVLDPAFVSGPVMLRDWFARLVDSKGVKKSPQGKPMNYACRNYWQGNGSIDTVCSGDGIVLVDAAGNLGVDDVEKLRGTICESSACQAAF